MAMRQHPLSMVFPSMAEDELDSMAADIKANGQKEAVIVFDGMVLDGWHRYRACEKAGVKCVTIKHDGSDPVAFVLSRNLHRRHLTASQRAAAIVAATSWRPQGRPGNKPEPGSGFSEAAMAAAAETTDRTIRQAKVAHEAGLGDAVRDGKVSAKQAAEVAKLPPKKREQAKAAIERGEKPPKASAKPPVDPRDAEITELRARLAEAADEVERLSATRAGDVDTEQLIARLQSELRTVKAKRDNLMRENAEMKRQIKFLERKAA